MGAIAALPDWSPVLKAANGRWFPAGWLAARLAGRRLRRLRVLPAAVLPAWRERGIEPLLCREIARVGARLGFLRAVYAPLPAAGDVIAALEALGAEKAQAFRLYEKTLGSEGW